MGHSSLLGTEPAPLEPRGRDTMALGPGDSSDSGSDVAGVEDWLDSADPSEPVDVALRPDRQRSALPSDALGGSPSDAAGTGERRSAASDAGRREAPDISVDRVFDPNDPLADEPLDDIEELPRAEIPLPLPEEEEDDEEEEDESADPVGDGHSDADAAEALPRKS